MAEHLMPSSRRVATTDGKFDLCFPVAEHAYHSALIATRALLSTTLRPLMHRPSFRDAEVVWENVRVLPDGETVSVDGTHLGHNLPDSSGNRYCINLVSVAGQPK